LAAARAGARVAEHSENHKKKQELAEFNMKDTPGNGFTCSRGVAVIRAKNHKRQRRKRQSVTAKRGKSQTPKILTAILTLPNLT